MISWGSFQQNGKQSKDQLQLEIPIVDKETCQKKWTQFSSRITPELLESTFVCAGGQVGQGPCMGDSGAPLAARSKNKDEGYVLFGLNSSGSPKCGSGVPDLFTRVSNYTDWINAVVFDFV